MPTAHSVQLDALVAVENVPARQVLQVWLDDGVPAAAMKLPGVQAVTGVQLVCPVVAAKLVPAVHATQLDWPPSAWALPMGHAEQLA